MYVLNGDTLSGRADLGLGFAVQEQLVDGRLVEVVTGTERADGYVW